MPVGYGIRKLQIGCVVEDDKVRLSSACVQMHWLRSHPRLSALSSHQVGTDFLEEEILKFEDYVQSVDVAAFNKI
jgi:translation elongation factor EF-1beta